MSFVLDFNLLKVCIQVLPDWNVMCFLFVYFKGYYFIIYLFGHEARGILVPWLGIKPSPPAVGVQNLNL